MLRGGDASYISVEAEFEFVFEITLIRYSVYSINTRKTDRSFITFKSTPQLIYSLLIEVKFYNVVNYIYS